MRLYMLIFTILISLTAYAQGGEDSSKYVHRFEVEFAPGGIFHTNEFLEGNNTEGRTMNHSQSVKLKYAFMAPQGSVESSIYKNAYQGIGVAFHEFNPQLSNPISAYLFQGARISRLSDRLSLNYEWNLGMTFGWKPYDRETNQENRVIGSKVTAYMNLDVYLNWMLTNWMDLNLGVSFSHYSNGNTEYPNSGLNTWGVKLGAACYLNRDAEKYQKRGIVVPFKRHVSYDLVLYGAWRKQGYVGYDGSMYALPGKYSVWGFNFNPMYNLNHWLNVGASVDGVYDTSANIEMEYGHSDVTGESYWKLIESSGKNQMALGLSGRVEFVMPYFSINFGVGKYLINGTNDFSGMYELLALKVKLTRFAFLHIGYTLNDFKNPRHLMLGFGIRFNNKRVH